MSIVCGLDLHRQQITFDALETESGEVWRGRASGTAPGVLPSAEDGGQQMIDAPDAAQSESAKLLMSRIVAMYTSGIATRSRQSPAWHVPLTVRLATETPASASLR